MREHAQSTDHRSTAYEAHLSQAWKAEISERLSCLPGDLKSEVDYQMIVGGGVQGRGNMKFKGLDRRMSME